MAIFSINKVILIVDFANIHSYFFYIGCTPDNKNFSENSNLSQDSSDRLPSLEGKKQRVQGYNHVF